MLPLYLIDINIEAKKYLEKMAQLNLEIKTLKKIYKKKNLIYYQKIYKDNHKNNR